MRRRITNGDESDVHSRWRNYLLCYRRPGATKAVKRRTNRRERREGKRETRGKDS